MTSWGKGIILQYELKIWNFFYMLRKWRYSINNCLIFNKIRSCKVGIIIKFLYLKYNISEHKNELKFKCDRNFEKYLCLMQFSSGVLLYQI